VYEQFLNVLIVMLHVLIQLIDDLVGTADTNLLFTVDTQHITLSTNSYHPIKLSIKKCIGACIAQ
jgi:hypothetical protein